MKDTKVLKLIWLAVLVVGVLSYFAVIGIIRHEQDARSFKTAVNSLYEVYEGTDELVDTLDVEQVCNSGGVVWVQNSPCQLEVANNYGLVETYNPQQVGLNQ